MKLLLDQNRSPKLVGRLADLFPDAIHVSSVGLDRASDDEVWTFAKANDCIIITKDADFTDVSVLRGFPPKIIWLRTGNCTTQEVEQTLRRGHPQIAAFASDPSLGVLELI